MSVIVVFLRPLGLRLVSQGVECYSCLPKTAWPPDLDGFWDKGSFYDRLTAIQQFGIEKNADQIGMAAAGAVGLTVAAHAAVTAVKRLTRKPDRAADKNKPT